MRILFVDDERRVLEGIERLLFHKADEWDVVCVGSGAEALEELEDEPFDVIVTDMRMPRMDGAALLAEVHARFPKVVRFVLSGHAELEASLRAVPIAHQFLTKPCKAEILEGVVERALALQQLMGDVAVCEAIGHIKELPSLPAVYAELTQALTDPDTGTGEVAAIVEKDMAMSAKVLQLVNSSFFSRGAEIAEVRAAVVRLGIDTVKNLVLTVEVFKPRPSGGSIAGTTMEALQAHALLTGALASKIVEDRAQAKDAMIAGILHDVGKLILAQELPDRMDAALARAERDGVPIHEAEALEIGVGHGEIGGYLLGIWGLPYPVVEAVSHHHAPLRAPEREGISILAAVHLANAIASGTEPDEALVARLGVADRIDGWRQLAEELSGR